jgi:hypothetical protein
VVKSRQKDQQGCEQESEEVDEMADGVERGEPPTWPRTKQLEQEVTEIGEGVLQTVCQV